jgi:hypothetical protein
MQTKAFYCSPYFVDERCEILKDFIHSNDARFDVANALIVVSIVQFVRVCERKHRKKKKKKKHTQTLSRSSIIARSNSRFCSSA